MEKKENSSEGLTLLYQAETPQEAHVIRTYLENNDIDVFIFDDHHSNIAWHYQMALGGARVMVPVPRKEDAVRLLEQIREEKIPDTKTQDEKKPSFIWRMGKGWLRYSVSVILSLLTMFPFIWRKKQ